MAAAALRNQVRFLGWRTLVITGERGEESPCRATYATFAPHRTDKREREKLRRHVDHHRPILAWSEAQVWDILRRWRVNPHPAYRLGWGRCSCAGCIFGSNDQWASLRAVNPAQFAQIAAYEQAFGWTIRRDEDVTTVANAGQPYAAITPELMAEARDTEWNGPIILPEGVTWTLPAGAFGDSTGPS